MAVERALLLRCGPGEPEGRTSLTWKEVARPGWHSRHAVVEARRAGSGQPSHQPVCAFIWIYSKVCAKLPEGSEQEGPTTQLCVSESNRQQ